MLTAVDGELGAVDVTRLLGAQEVDGFGHLLSLPEPPHRDIGISVAVHGDRIAVSISPSEIALTLMPSGAKSAAISRVSAASAAFEVA